MEAYADFQFYKKTYGGTLVLETEFRALSLKATALIDKLTFHRATATEEVRLAMCVALEALYTPAAGGVSSENNDGYSVTYREKNAEEALREACAAIRSFLPKELTNRGCWD